MAICTPPGRASYICTYIYIYIPFVHIHTANTARVAGVHPAYARAYAYAYDLCICIPPTQVGDATTPLANPMNILCPRSARSPIAPDTDFDCAVLGIGRLGLCFALTLERAGLKVIGVDVSEGYVRAISNKELVSDEPGLTEALKESVNFEVTTDLSKAVKGTKLPV